MPGMWICSRTKVGHGAILLMSGNSGSSLSINRSSSFCGLELGLGFGVWGWGFGGWGSVCTHGFPVTRASIPCRRRCLRERETETERSPTVSTVLVAYGACISCTAHCPALTVPTVPAPVQHRFTCVYGATSMPGISEGVPVWSEASAPQLGASGCLGASAAVEDGGASVLPGAAPVNLPCDVRYSD